MEELKIVKDPKCQEDLFRMCVMMHKESRFHGFPINEGKLKSFIRMLSERQDSVVFQLNKGECPIGFIFAGISTHFFSDVTTSCDRSFYIIPEERGIKGMNMLFDSYISWAKEKNVSEITIGSTVGYKTDKIEILFKRKGFERNGVLYTM